MRWCLPFDAGRRLWVGGRPGAKGENARQRGELVRASSWWATRPWRPAVAFYGNQLCERFQQVACLNLARGGRSTKSYRAKGCGTPCCSS